MGEIRHGRIKLVDGALEMLYGDNTGPLVTVEVMMTDFIQASPPAAQLALQRPTFKPCGPVISLMN